MTATELVLARLTGVSGVTALVGTRIYDHVLAQSPTHPTLLLTLVFEGQDAHMRGVINFRRARVQVDAIVREASGVDALALAREVEAAAFGDGAGSALAGWAGSLGSPAQAVTGILPLDKRESYDGEALREFRVSRDYYVFHQE